MFYIYKAKNYEGPLVINWLFNDVILILLLINNYSAVLHKITKY